MIAVSPRLWLAIAILLDCQLSSSAEERPLQRFSASKPEMGVEFEVILYASDEAAAKQGIDAAFARIAELNKILSDYDPESETLRLSAASPNAQPVAVSSDLFFVINKSKLIHEQSAGAFDPTMGPLTKIWRRARRQNELPTADAITAAKKSVGMQFVELPKPGLVQLKQADMRLDFGGIAKGYAAEEALLKLKELGFTRALVRGAGDIAAGDAPPDAKGWTVGIAPLDPNDKVTESITVANECVSTSGDARQHLIVDGKRYSHILDPRTGDPIEGRSSVSVVGKSGWQVDGFATAFSVLGPEASLKVAKEQNVRLLMIVEREGKQVRFASEDWQSGASLRDVK